MPSQPPAPADARVALPVASLASFLTPFMGASANVALPAIARDLGLDALELSWVATSFLLAAAVALVPFGQLADIHGRKRIFSRGIAVYALGSLLSALSPGGGWLVAARALQGVGGAMIFGTSVALLTSVFPPERRGWALGINAASVYVGLSIGPVAGGLITEGLGWRALFVVNAALAAALFVVVRTALTGEWAGNRRARFDAPGALIYAVALGLLMTGLSRADTAAGLGGTLAGLAALAAFVAFERRAASPMLDVRLFSTSRVFAWSNLAALINYSATFAVGFLLSLYLQQVRGLGPRAAGLVLVAQPLLMAAVSPAAGRLSDRVAPRIVASAGMALTAAGLALLAPLGPSTPLAYVVACLALLGTGFGLFSSPNTNAVMGAVAPAQYGVAAATLGTMRLGGQMLSMGVAMLALSVTGSAAQAAGAASPAVLAALRLTFVVFAVSCGLGVLASAARGTTPPAPAAG